MRTSGTARVRITLDIAAGSSWGDECTIQQVHEQAKRETVARIRTALQKTDFVLVGEPEITVITHQVKP